MNQFKMLKLSTFDMISQLQYWISASIASEQVSRFDFEIGGDTKVLQGSNPESWRFFT